jgi:ubiquitin-protein ligase
MSRDAVFAEAEQILALFPEFWAVDENIYHLFGVIQKTGVKQYTVEVYFPADFPNSAPQIRISKEVSELLGKQIELKTLSSWKKGTSKVVDILKELKMLVDRMLEMDMADLKTSPKEGAPKSYAEFATPEPFEFRSAGNKPSGVKAVPRRGEDIRIKEVAEPEDDIKVYVPDGKTWSEEGLEDHKTKSSGTFDETTWEPATNDVGADAKGSTGDPEKDAALKTELDRLMTEYSIDYASISEVNIYLSISVESTFIIHVNYANYPERPKLELPDDLKSWIPNPTNSLKTLREWNPAEPPAVVDVIRELEGKLWSLNEIEAKLKRIFGEFEAVNVPNSKTAVKVTILTFGFQEFHVTIDIKDFPRPPRISYSQNLAALIKAPPEQLKVMQNWDNNEEKEPVAIVREINWLIDKESRMAFEIDLLKSNLKDVKWDPVTKIVLVKMKGSLKTQEVTFDFKVTLPENYPMSPPKVDMLSELDEESMETKMQVSLKNLLTNWNPNASYLIDAFNALSKAIFEVSVISCIICHKIPCVTCTNPLDSPDPNVETCKVECPYCNRVYHKHCWDQTIASFQKCGFCLRPPPSSMVP